MSTALFFGSRQETSRSHMNLVLIGYRCSGKTTVGRVLSERLKRIFVDTDVLIEEHCGKSIPSIVFEEGWNHFRGIEKKVIREFSLKENMIIATGGGAVMEEENMYHLKKDGLLVWLRVGSETLRGRMIRNLGRGSQRPSLTSTDSLEEISRVLRERIPAYRRAADFVVDADHLSVEEVVQKIVESVRTYLFQ